MIEVGEDLLGQENEFPGPNHSFDVDSHQKDEMLRMKSRQGSVPIRVSPDLGSSATFSSEFIPYPGSPEDPPKLPQSPLPKPDTQGTFTDSIQESREGGFKDTGPTRICCIGFNPERSSITVIVRVKMGWIQGSGCGHEIPPLQVSAWLRLHQGPWFFTGSKSVRVHKLANTSQDLLYSFEFEIFPNYIAGIRPCNETKFLRYTIRARSRLSDVPVLAWEVVNPLPYLPVTSLGEALIQFPKLSRFGEFENTSAALPLLGNNDTLIQLNDLRILFTQVSSVSKGVFIYDPFSEAICPVPPPFVNGQNYDLRGSSVLRRSDDKVVFFGASSGAEKFNNVLCLDTSTLSWSKETKLLTPRSYGVAAELFPTRIVLAGGVSGSTPVMTTEVLKDGSQSLAKNTLSTIQTRSPKAISFLTGLAWLGKTRQSNGSFNNSIFFSQWEALFASKNPFLPNINEGSIACMLPILPRMAGRDDYSMRVFALDGVEAFELDIYRHRAWMPIPKRPLSVRRLYGCAVPLADGTILLAGGYNRLLGQQLTPDSQVVETEIYNQETGEWTVGASFPSGVRVGALAGCLLADGRVLFSSYDRPGISGPANQAFIYTPDYLWRKPRPIFQVKRSILKVSETLEVQLGGGWDIVMLSKLVLVNLSSHQQGFSSSSRIHILNLEGDTFNLRIPLKNVPGGTYWAFLVSDTGCPSKALTIKINYE
jgi:hypothetical protein